MTALIQYTLSGLVIGGLYAIVALGFFIMWSAVRAVNFAHGDTLMLGSVLAVVLMWAGVPLVVGIPLAIIASALFGMFIERIAVRPLNHGPSSIGWMLSTIAVGLMLEAFVTVTFGADPARFPRRSWKSPSRSGARAFSRMKCWCRLPRSACSRYWTGFIGQRCWGEPCVRLLKTLSRRA